MSRSHRHNNHPYDNNNEGVVLPTPLGVVIDRSTRLYLNHIPVIALDRFGYHALYEDFLSFGPIERYQLFTDPSGRFTGAGIVTYRNAADARTAMQQMRQRTTFLFQESKKKKAAEEGGVVESTDGGDGTEAADDEDFELRLPIAQPLHVSMAKEHGVVLVDQLRRQYKHHATGGSGGVLSSTNDYGTVLGQSEEGALPTAAALPSSSSTSSSALQDVWKHDRFSEAQQQLPSEVWGQQGHHYRGGRGGGRGRGGRGGPHRGGSRVPWELADVDASFETYLTNRDTLLKKEGGEQVVHSPEGTAAPVDGQEHQQP